MTLFTLMVAGSAHAGPITTTSGTPILHVAPASFLHDLDRDKLRFDDSGSIPDAPPDLHDVGIEPIFSDSPGTLPGTPFIPDPFDPFVSVTLPGDAAAAIPEPVTLLLVAPGIGLALRRRMRQTRNGAGAMATPFITQA